MLIKVKSMPFQSIGVEHLTEVAKLDCAIIFNIFHFLLVPFYNLKYSYNSELL